MGHRLVTLDSHTQQQEFSCVCHETWNMFIQFLRPGLKSLNKSLSGLTEHHLQYYGKCCKLLCKFIAYNLVISILFEIRKILCMSVDASIIMTKRDNCLTTIIIDPVISIFDIDCYIMWSMLDF